MRALAMVTLGGLVTVAMTWSGVLSLSAVPCPGCCLCLTAVPRVLYNVYVSLRPPSFLLVRVLLAVGRLPGSPLGPPLA